MRPTTVEIEESGLEQRRPMRIRRLSGLGFFSIFPTFIDFSYTVLNETAISCPAN